MLPTSKSWKFDFENNRKKLIEELKNKPPEYILMQIGPEQIFDQMFLFQDFGRFVSQNYNFEKKFGNILIFKIKDGVKITKSDLPIIPLELIKYYSAITKVDYRDDQTEVTFEPMVNPNGILRIFKTIYPSTLNVNFEPITIKILGQDGSDFVGNSFLKPSGTIDLHFQIEGVKEGIIFARIKADNITYNNKSYGVNYALKLIEHENLADLYIEPPLNWKGKNLEIYFICEDGSLAKTYANL